MEIGESSEQGLTVFSRKNRQIIEAFKGIADEIIALTGGE